jgi:molecular chaperone GrpE
MAKKKSERMEEHMEEQVEEQAGEETEAEARDTVQAGEDGREQVDIAAIENELAEARSKSEEYLEGWQRARAEFANYKKRVERDQELVQKNAAGNAIRRFLDIVDDLDRALKNRPKEGEGADWAGGVELIYRKLLAILEAEGVQPIPVEGQMFDPNLHEAISQEESLEHASGEIIGVVQNGYTLGERVLRPARVRVAR